MTADDYKELEITTYESRKNIRLLAGLIHVLKNGRLPVQACLQIAEGIDSEVGIADGLYVRKLIDQQREMDKQQAAPVSGKVM